MAITEVFDIAANLSLLLGAVLAGIWAIFRYFKLREAKRALTISVRPQLFSLGSSTVVEISIDLTNSGSVPIEGTITTTSKCQLHVKKITELPGTNLFSWDDTDLEPLTAPIPYLKYYDTCILEPGVPCEVKGYATFQTDYLGLLLLFAEFTDTSDTWWADWKIIDTRDAVKHGPRDPNHHRMACPIPPNSPIPRTPYSIR